MSDKIRNQLVKFVDECDPIINMDWTAYCYFCGKVQSKDYLYNDPRPNPEHEADCLYCLVKGAAIDTVPVWKLED